MASKKLHALARIPEYMDTGKWGMLMKAFLSYHVIYDKKKIKVNVQELCKSSRGAMYTLLGSTNKFASGNLRVLLKLFDRMILPICTYNCEVWRSTFCTRKFAPSDFLSEQKTEKRSK